MLTDLLEAGLLQGNLDDMMAANLGGRVFHPCGLGHLMGMDVHDVGGYLEDQPARPEGAGLKSLRTARLLQVKDTFQMWVRDEFDQLMMIFILD
jgi:Xaa-Pro dipeptidase